MNSIQQALLPVFNPSHAPSRPVERPARNQEAARRPVPARAGAPAWFFFATALLTLAILLMAVAETTLWTHYLIDEGEYLSMIGVVFVMASGLALHYRRQLVASLPLTVPWLLYPVLTQGDQIIDNLTINQMRLVTHALLALIFGAPVIVLVLAARRWLAPTGAFARTRRWTALVPGLRQIEMERSREGGATLAGALILLEVAIACQFLGSLMVFTLIAMGICVLAYGSTITDEPGTRRSGPRHRSESIALFILMSGAALSVGLYATFKNRPGAYQGSPHHYHDAARPDAGFDLDRITIPSGPAANLSPANEHAIRGIAAGYGHALNEQLQAYYVLDRNYNYAFHNALFLRQTTVLADFRTIALDRINKARSTAAQTDAACDRLRDELRSDDPLRAFLDDLRGFVAFSFERAAQLAEMSASFEKTQAGLQHATHLYEGEGKIVGQWLASVLEKHERLLTDRRFHGMAGPVVEASRSIREMYANRIVGF